jgi:ABC-type glycerol-3-phosphate transport system substrate-binding protein
MLRPSHSTRLLLPLIILTLVALFAAGCAGPDLRNPPRLATQTARAGLTPTPSMPPLSLPAPTATGEPLDQTAGAGQPSRNATITLWVNSSQPQYQAALAEMIDTFRASHDIHVELVTIAPDLLPDLINTAAVSETFPLPDLVMMPLEYVVGWAERGILDVDAADSARTRRRVRPGRGHSQRWLAAAYPLSL